LRCIQGGASSQFSAIPLNLAGDADTVDYVVTGSWSKKAAGEAKKYAKVNVVATGDNKSVPDPATWKLSSDAKYVHYCDNETIQGVEFKVPLMPSAFQAFSAVTCKHCFAITRSIEPCSHPPRWAARCWCLT
jgi:phosphoserine aminotransferase